MKYLKLVFLEIYNSICIIAVFLEKKEIYIYN